LHAHCLARAPHCRTTPALSQQPTSASTPLWRTRQEGSSCRFQSPASRATGLPSAALSRRSLPLALPQEVPAVPARRFSWRIAALRAGAGTSRTRELGARSRSTGTRRFLRLIPRVRVRRRRRSWIDLPLAVARILAVPPAPGGLQALQGVPVAGNGFTAKVLLLRSWCSGLFLQLSRPC
jgi:hypothetical protein